MNKSSNLSQEFKDRLNVIFQKHEQKLIENCKKCISVKDKKYCKFCIQEKIELFAGRPLIYVKRPTIYGYIPREDPINYDDLILLHLILLHRENDISELIDDGFSRY